MKKNSSPTTLPPPYHCIHRHALLPTVSHDEAARFNFLSNLGVHIGTRIFPGLGKVYESKKARWDANADSGKPTTGSEVRDAVKQDPAFQNWSALRRATMEMRQQAGRAVVFRQLPTLVEKAVTLNRGKLSLHLDPDCRTPGYLAAVDNHCAPGSYHTEVVENDISAAANYEVGHYVIAGGGTGSRGDAIGAAMAHYVATTYPDFRPKRIVDLGAGAGLNTVPIALAFPDAEVIALDVAAPMLRYGHARAQLMGASNITFVQGDGEHYPIPGDTVDWVQTNMVWHETSTEAFKHMLRRIYAWLRPGGLSLNMEQPNFDERTTPFEKYVRDWDAWYNGEPFWAKLHTMKVKAEMVAAGFAADRVFEAMAPFTLNEPGFPTWAATFNRHDHEERLRDDRRGSPTSASGSLYVFGAIK